MAKLQEKVDKQAEIVPSQQNFLEALDRKEIETKPDEGESMKGETSDQGKLPKLWRSTEEMPEMTSFRRLGRDGDGARKRPILMTLPTREAHDKILAKIRRLKEAGAPNQQIFKKDVHPSMGNEWKRLRDVEVAEKRETRGRRLYNTA